MFDSALEVEILVTLGIRMFVPRRYCMEHGGCLYYLLSFGVTTVISIPFITVNPHIYIDTRRYFKIY